MPVLSAGLLEGNWFIVPKVNRRRWKKKNILHIQGYVQPCSAWKCLASSNTSPFPNHAYPSRFQRFSTTDFRTGYYLYLGKSAGGSSASLEIAQIASASLDDLLKVSQPQYSKQLLLHFSAPSLSPQPSNTVYTIHE